jgi:hypothetical protein
VGVEARNPRLRTKEAHDIAVEHLCGILLPCMNCFCFCRTDIGQDA